MTVATRSVNLALQPTKTQVWQASCQDPIPPEFQQNPHSAVWVDIFKFMATSRALLSWESRPPWRKNRELPPHLQTSMPRDAMRRAVNDLLTMYVGAIQHVLRMSFAPEQEAYHFDRQVTTFWAHFMQRDIASPLFYLSKLNHRTQIRFRLKTTAKSPTGKIPNHLFTTNEQTRSSPENHSKETSLHRPKKPFF